MNEVKDFLNRAKKGVCKTAEEVSSTAKLTVAIEKQKCRLSQLYEAIGTAVVNRALAPENEVPEPENVSIDRLIEEAKAARAALAELCKKKKELSAKGVCPTCGKTAHKDSYCPSCGTYVK